MSVVFGRVVVVFILCLGIWFLFSFQWGSLDAPFNRRVQEKIEQRLEIHLPSEFTADCVVSCFPVLSRTRHAIELHFNEKDFDLLLGNWNINVSQVKSIVSVWSGCDRATGTLQSAFVDLESRRLFFDHGTLTKGERC